MKKSIILPIALLAVGLAFVHAQSNETIVQGNTLAEKFDWLKVFAQSNGSYILEVNANEDSYQNLSYSGKSGIIITLRGVGANRTLNNGFTVNSGVALVLEDNITLRGRVSVQGGGLVMYAGSTITGNRFQSFSYSEGGGGVYVCDGGNFTLRGGTISGNTADEGGGVYVGRDGTFIMAGGTISGNKANMNGGGVYVGIGGTFTMLGGTISGNTANNGGGGVNSWSTFTMRGGTISGNSNYTSGGGVVVNNGTFTMIGGEILGNSSGSGGGGVYVGSTTTDGATFTMSGGTISGNIAKRWGGGGVSVAIRNTFNMSGGTISGNTANGGGGSYVDMGGGGVEVDSGGNFAKTGGTIYGYSAGDTFNSNAVKNESGAVQNFRGHAVRAGSTETLLKIREGTAGPGDNMSFTGASYNDRSILIAPANAGGVWDN